MHLYSSISDAEPGKAYRWRGAPVPCVCWYMYLQTSSQANIVSRPHTLPMSVWYDFHWHHFLRNRCMKPGVVAMQKTVPLCCDLYQMNYVCTCGLATGDTVLVLIVDDNFLQYPQYSDPIISISPWSIHSSLRLPCLWEQPKCATDTELITTDLVQYAYTRTTRSSAALQRAGHLNPECDLVLKMSHWGYVVAIQNLRDWHKNLLLINMAIHGVT